MKEAMLELSTHGRYLALPGLETISKDMSLSESFGCLALASKTKY
jgi:hypothetical protein